MMDYMKISSIVQDARMARTMKETAWQTSYTMGTVTTDTQGLLDALDSEYEGGSTDSDVSKTQDRVKKYAYENLRLAAERSRESLEALRKTGENTLFPEGDETEEQREALQAEIDRLVSSLNLVMEKLKGIGDTVNGQLYSKFDEFLKAHEEELKGIGILRGEDGSLRLDETLFTAADRSAVKGLFGDGSTFSSELDQLLEAAQKNAAEQAELLEKKDVYGSSSYDEAGSFLDNFMDGFYSEQA